MNYVNSGMELSQHNLVRCRRGFRTALKGLIIGLIIELRIVLTRSFGQRHWWRRTLTVACVVQMYCREKRRMMTKNMYTARPCASRLAYNLGLSVEHLFHW